MISQGTISSGPISSLADIVIGILFDAASNSGYQTLQSTYSWSHTCTGLNGYLTVGVSMLSVAGSQVTGITYNGVSMDRIEDQSSVTGAIRAELWGLVNPSTGTNTISVTLSVALDSVGTATSYTGVHQTSPIEAANTASATNGVGAADATVNITTVADNDWTVNVVATNDTSITAASGNNSKANVSGTLGSGAMGNIGPDTPPSSVTNAWTNVAGLATWSIVAVALRPIAAVSLAPIFFRKTFSRLGTKAGVRQLVGV